MTRGMQNGSPWIECPHCKRRSFHPQDVLEGYCGNCHDWTSSNIEEDKTCEGVVKDAVYNYLKSTGQEHLCPPS